MSERERKRERVIERKIGSKGKREKREKWAEERRKSFRVQRFCETGN